METQPTVLLVDDDRTFTPLIQEYLTAKGMVVEMRHNGDDGLAAFLSGNFHLCVLDVKMPMKDGFTLAQEIRERDAQMPFIFISAQSEKESRIKGLLLGADDYITKPFSMEELFLRITAILRRVGLQQQQQRETPQVYQVGKFTFSPTTRELIADGFLQKMTGTEAKLLEMFLENESGTIEREQALKRVWGDEDYLRGRSLNVYVSKLRHFLKDDPRIEILNRHGEGYRLVVRR